MSQFPSEYTGTYFFADFCAGWIRRLDQPNYNAAVTFATGISLPVDLKVATDGSLYYLARGSGSVLRISYSANQAPSIGTHPVSQTIPEGQPVTFSVAASGTPPLSYQWQRNGTDIPGANSSSYTLASASLGDNGTKFKVIVTNAFDSATSNEATLTVTANQPPIGNITAPVAGTLYSAGETIDYSGTGTDPETGNLPASAFTWQVDFHHDEHTHPVIPTTTGSTSGSFTILTTGETSANVWYRIHLTVRDSFGLTHSSFRDVLPRTSTITLATNPTGLQLTLDGQPVTTPVQVLGVVGMTRTLGVVTPQVVGGISYQFSSWSDGGTASHNISTPASNTIYTANFTAQLPASITTHPSSLTVPEGQPATLSVVASGTAPLSYQWERNGVNIGGANSPSYTLASASLADNGAKFKVIVTNAFGGATSNEATLAVTANQPPVGNITSPVAGTLYNAGQTINYSGAGTDPETGNLPASAFTWRVDFHHDAQTDPFIPATTGSTSGSFMIPTTGETSANVWYRIHLTVRDSFGLTHSSFRDVLPRTSTITLASNPTGLQLTLDGQPVTTPVQVVGVVGMTRTLGVVSPQIGGGISYQFSSWSDGGAASHNISTAAANTTYTATFAVQQQALQLSSASYSAGEGSGTLNITVTRSSGTSGEVSVDYAANGGTASERTDYTTLVGTLRFLSGETSKTVTLLLTDDGFVDGDKTVNLTLSNPSGAVLGGQNISTVTITDNDSAPSPSNPIDQTPIFVRQHYNDFLNRAPEPGGFQGWQDILNGCPQGSAACDRIEVSSAFFRSLEFQQRGYFVYRFYSSSFGRIPHYAEFMPDMARVSGFQSVEQEEASKVAFINAFTGRQEFKNRYDGVTDPRAYVEALEAAAGVVLANREALIADLVAGRKTRAEVLRAVVESTEVFQKYFNQAFVVMQYFSYLRRDPDILYLNWIDTLNSTGDYRIMVNGFLNSTEYRSRFGQP